HAMIEVPKGEKHPSFPAVPELETFARSERDRKIMTMQRAFRVAGQPFVLPPGTPKDRVEIIRKRSARPTKIQSFTRNIKNSRPTNPRRSCLMRMRKPSEKFPAIRRSRQSSNRLQAPGHCRRGETEQFKWFKLFKTFNPLPGSRCGGGIRRGIEQSEAV